MTERIKKIMEFVSMSSTQFADHVEVPRAVMSHILSGRNKPSLEVVTKIVAVFPEIDLRWVLLGEGDMLKQLAPVVAPVNKAPNLAIDSTQTDNPAKSTVNDVVKVQNEDKAEPAISDAERSEKTIEQIVIFYSDKTFMAYKP
ncbi:helix-turn-helix transcriptional regulator [Pontibacter sp. H249]|uniref:helix-turn-helix transcriptional regulator n=1 Tax=Pontibacter sp. H249 TaxID=3133420 RepID=UPI0030BB9EE0